MVVTMTKSSKMAELQAKHMEQVVHHLNSAMNQTKEYYQGTYNRVPPNVVELEMFTEKVIKLVQQIPEEPTTILEFKLAKLKEKVLQFQDNHKVYVLNNLIRAYEIELIHRRARREQQSTH